MSDGALTLVPPAQAPLTVRGHYAQGDPGPIVTSLAHVPELVEPALGLFGAALGPSWIPLRTKEIVILRTSSVAGCRYCTDTHTVAALDAGLSRAEVDGLRGDGDAARTAFDGAERTLVEWSDAVVHGTPAELAGVRAHMLEAYGEPALVELTLLATTTLLLNRYATALGLPTSAETLSRLAAEGYR